MDKRQERALVKETKALIKEVETGDTEHAAWVAIQDRVRQLYEGRSQKATGELIGKSETWTRDLLRWDPQHAADPSPFAERGRVRPGAQNVSRALSDPEQRQKVIDTLPKKDLAAFATEAYEKLHEQREDRDETERQRRRAIREETSEDPYLAHYELIRLQLAKIESTIADAVRYANDAGRAWPEQYTAKLVERIGRNREMLGILELAVSNSDEVDWDAELERLTTAEEA